MWCVYCEVRTGYLNTFWSVLCIWCWVSGQKLVFGRPSERTAGSQYFMRSEGKRWFCNQTERCTACLSHSTSLPPSLHPSSHQNSVPMQWPLKFFLRTRTVHLTSRYLLHFQKLQIVCNLCLPEGRTGTEFKLSESWNFLFPHINAPSFTSISLALR
jgi:hypothetical protein